MRGFSWTALAAVLFGLSVVAAAADTQSVRPNVAKPLQAAQAAIQDKRYAEALARLNEAAQAKDLTPYEQYLIARMRSNAALNAGDHAGALAAYEALAASPELPEADKAAVFYAVARLSYEAKDYAKAAEYAKAYRGAGGTDVEVSTLLAQALYLSGDYRSAQQELKARIAAADAAQQTLSELQLQLYGNSAVKLDDKAAYRDALEHLVAAYPKPAYWQDLIARTISQPGFSNRWVLDMYRLKAATGTIDTAQEYRDAAQLALQAGLPGEASQYLEQGYAKGILGAGEAAKDKTLKAQVDAKVAEDKRTLAEGERLAAKQAGGDALVETGLNYVGYGQYDKGAALIAAGLAKGKLKQPDAAKLHLGYAQMRAGQFVEARQTFEGVAGGDGGAALAKLWLLVKPAS